MAYHKKILYLTGYYLVVVTPNPIDVNAMQDLDQIYFIYVTFLFNNERPLGPQYNLTI